ncbi:MAG TPA: hypothetical protein VHP99_05630, partial [Pyrinomonadaceae bacterium]|nr:hypothetical protein [Pyrinomonadaceae bacterium]
MSKYKPIISSIFKVSARQSQSLATGELAPKFSSKRQLDMPQIRFLHGVSNDLYYALRSMRRNLPFTLIFVITLSVGIGINTAAFSMINAWVWHPVSLPAPQELVVLSRLD